MTTILTNILIFIVTAIVFVRTSGQTHEIYKLPGLLIPSILSAAWIVLANISSIAYTYTEYRMVAEFFANEDKFDFALIVCVVICGLTIYVFMFRCDNFPLVELLARYKQVDSALGNTPRIPYSTFKKMYKLHPENFKFIDPQNDITFYSFEYRGKKFSLNFLDFVRALSLVDEHITEKDLARERALCETCNTIVSHMRWDDEYGFGELREEALKIERETTNVNQQKDPRCGVQEI